MGDIANNIKELERQLSALKEKQRTCQHQFGDAKYDPYEKQEEYLTGDYETHGVHHWPKTAFKPVMKPRWSRTCTKCDFVQYTEKQAVVSVKQEPDFR